MLIYYETTYTTHIFIFRWVKNFQDCLGLSQVVYVKIIKWNAYNIKITYSDINVDFKIYIKSFSVWSWNIFILFFFSEIINSNAFDWRQMILFLSIIQILFDAYLHDKRFQIYKLQLSCDDEINFVNFWLITLKTNLHITYFYLNLVWGLIGIQQKKIHSMYNDSFKNTLIWNTKNYVKIFLDSVCHKKMLQITI